MAHYFLITGSRDFPADKADVIYETLDNFLKWQPDLVMINGAAKGADTICAAWAEDRGVPVEYFAASWTKYGRAAGPIRNKAMLNRLLAMKSTSVFAFFYGDPATSVGTRNMVLQCEQAGVTPVQKVVDRVSV